MRDAASDCTTVSCVCPASNWLAVLPKPCGNKADATREVAVDGAGNFSSDPAAHEEVVGRVTSELNRANSRAFNALRAIGFLHLRVNLADYEGMRDQEEDALEG